MANVKRLFDLLTQYEEKYARPDALAAKENGKWIHYSTADFIGYVNDLSYGFLALGIQKNDRIGLISNNRPEWNFVDMAALQVGAVSVPIYPTISENDLQYIIKDSEMKYIFVANSLLYEKVKKILAQCPTLKEIYTFNQVDGAKNWKELIQLGKSNANARELELIKANIRDNELATLIYTSGTTGFPKGVMLSHRNLVTNFHAARNLAPFKKTWKALSFLPLNHVYERMITYMYMNYGVGIYYAESIDTIGDNLKEVKPNIFVSVPRLLEKVFDKIVAKGNELTGVKKQLFFWALGLGLKYELNGANGWWYETQLKIANKIIFNKWREALGNNVEVVVSGGAALQTRLERVFWAAGIPVLQGYGLTETSPVIAVNNFQPDCVRFGTVGPVIEDVEVKIAADGEILVKGPNVMLGYYKQPEQTAEAIDKEGFFHTGDIGQMVEGRFLKITDRKKEIFKTSGGKYIAPLLIENKLKESPFIEQAMVVGENEKYASALIVPAFVHLKEWCVKHNITFTTQDDMIKNQKVKDRIMEEVEKANKDLAKYETIKKIELLPREWSIEKGEMTPKLSLKRKVIFEVNKELIAKMYVE